MKIVKPPHPVPPKDRSTRPFFFLAGSIEMDEAVDWQMQVEHALRGYHGIILNPRRDDWDSSWKQTLEDKNFVEQVTWELDGMDLADHILMYFDPDTKAPITLMELGLHAHQDKLVVCCPEGYWRKGNVDIVCRRYGIPQVDSLEELITYAKSKTGPKLGHTLIGDQDEHTVSNQTWAGFARASSNRVEP